MWRSATAWSAELVAPAVLGMSVHEVVGATGGRDEVLSTCQVAALSVGREGRAQREKGAHRHGATAKK